LAAGCAGQPQYGHDAPVHIRDSDFVRRNVVTDVHSHGTREIDVPTGASRKRTRKGGASQTEHYLHDAPKFCTAQRAAEQNEAFCSALRTRYEPRNEFGELNVALNVGSAPNPINDSFGWKSAPHFA